MLTIGFRRWDHAGPPTAQPGKEVHIASVVYDVLVAWRQALRILEDNPLDPQSERIAEQIEVLRSIYQRLTSDSVPTSRETIERTRALIAETRALIDSQRSYQPKPLAPLDALIED